MNQDYRPVDYSKFPDELKFYPNWFPIRTRYVDGIPSYHPINIKHGGPANPGNQDTWTTFTKAVRYVNNHRAHFQFIGLVLTEKMGCFCLNFRDGVSGRDRAVEECQKAIKAFNTYTEVSHTRKGYNIIGIGDLRTDIMKNEWCRLEAKGKNRYVIVTGNPISDCPLNECQHNLDNMVHNGILQYSYKELKKRGKVTPMRVGGCAYGNTGS